MVSSKNGKNKKNERITNLVQRLCECGHQSCFHHPMPTGIRAMFTDAPPKACNMKECYCLRFTESNKDA